MDRHPNQVGSILRNPNNLAQDSIRIVSELDVHGRIRLIYSFQQNGHKKHREYSFTRVQLKEFLRQKHNIIIQFDQGISQTDSCFETVEPVTQYQPSTFDHLEYRVSNLPLPRSSFETSFQHKHEPNNPGVMSTMSSMSTMSDRLPPSNISGNTIDYTINAPSTVGM
jgi:hypothetical protein